MKISFDGIGVQTVTFKAASGVTAGIPVKISANDTVAACSAGDAFVGVTGKVESDGFAAVALHGFVKLPYTGDTAPEVGWSTLSGDGSGGVAVDAGGMPYLVVSVDTTDKTVCFFM